VLIVTFTRLLNIVLTPLRQPRVISEVIGGILLGPSVFGRIPGYLKTIFPEESKPQLNLAANVGLVLFLFIVGVEMNPKAIMKNAKAAISISAGGISLCFALGSAVSYGLYNNLTDKTQKFPVFLIFIGVAMSITVSLNLFIFFCISVQFINSFFFILGFSRPCSYSIRTSSNSLSGRNCSINRQC
jgi:Kef-type K+ transport system membrane component KefB